MSAEVLLRNGGIVLLDEADLPLVVGRKWRRMRAASGLEYAVASGRKGEPRAILMHRLILGFPEHQVDHANRNGLDNTRDNLRTCSGTQNNANRAKLEGRSSRFKGVSWHARSRQWVAAISQDNHDIKLGQFKSEERAARQYDRAARLVFGKFARTNEMMGLL